MATYHTWCGKMGQKMRWKGVAITVGSISVILSACTVVTEPRRAVPREEGAVLVGRVMTTPVEPTEGVIRCAVSYDGVTVCWLVADTVTAR